MYDISQTPKLSNVRFRKVPTVNKIHEMDYAVVVKMQVSEWSFHYAALKIKLQFVGKS